MNGIWLLPQKKSTYILRYFLPRPPYVKNEVTIQRLEELISFCLWVKITAVQFLVNFRDNWYYMPDGPKHAEAWAEEMKLYIPQIKSAGISYQLNLVNLLGSTTGEVDMRGDDYPWGYMVDHRGHVNDGCPCPLDTNFRDIMGRQLRAWASTGPDVIWIDDDFRLHNHGFWQGGLDWYCYCSRHLDLFSRRTGKFYNREELLQLITRPGAPSPERIAWLDFLNDTMVDTASWIQEQVHGVSPLTRLAQMTSFPDVHSVEGRNWGDFLRALAGRNHVPMTRPHFGPYTEIAPSGFIHSYTMLDQSLANMKKHYPEVIDACPELENTRFTRWAKSGAATRYQLILGQLLGCTGITLSLFDLEGTPLAEEPLYEKILINEKHPLDQLAKLGLAAWKPRGVGLLADPDSARKIQISESTVNSVSSLLGPGRTWDNLLLSLGVPAYYVPPTGASDTEVVALDGLTAWLPDDHEMAGILSKGVLLDSRAAEVLIRRGYRTMIGVGVGKTNKYRTSAEIFIGSVLEGLPDKRMPLRIMGGNWMELVPEPESRVLSFMITPEGTQHAATVLFENAAGGRIATYAGFNDVGLEFFNHTRVLWVDAILRWLSWEKFPLTVFAEQRVLAIRRDLDNKILLALANLAADRLEMVSGTIENTGRIRTVKKLNRKGRWEELELSFFQETRQGQYRFCVPGELHIYDWLILLIES